MHWQRTLGSVRSAWGAYGNTGTRTQLRLTIIKDVQHDEPGIASIEHAVLGCGEPPIHCHRHVLHGHSMMDVPTDDTDLFPLDRNDNVAVCGKAASWKLLIS